MYLELLPLVDLQLNEGGALVLLGVSFFFALGVIGIILTLLGLILHKTRIGGCLLYVGLFFLLAVALAYGYLLLLAYGRG